MTTTSKGTTPGARERQEFQNHNRDHGKPCYCASLTSGFCDMCTGLAAPHEDRWNEQLAEQSQTAFVLRQSRDKAIARAERAEADNARLREALANLADIAEGKTIRNPASGVPFGNRLSLGDAVMSARAALNPKS